MDDKGWIPSGDGLCPEMDLDRIWMDDWRWITGDGSRETDDNQSPFRYADIQDTRSYASLEITKLISIYEVTIERSYADIRWTGGMAPPSTIPSTTQSTIQRYGMMQRHAPVSMPNMIPNAILTQSRQSRDTQVLVEIFFTIKPNEPIWHPTKPEWISRRWSNDVQTGMTRPESTTTPTASNHLTENAGRKHFGAHLLEKNRSLRIVDGRVLEEITSRVNKRTWRRFNSTPGDETTSELRKRRDGYPDK